MSNIPVTSENKIDILKTKYLKRVRTSLLCGEYIFFYATRFTNYIFFLILQLSSAPYLERHAIS